MTEDEKFARAIDFTLQWEGGRNFSVVNGKPVIKGVAKADAGGATAYGVTWATLKSVHERAGVSHSDICRLTVEEAKRIYRVMYWDKWNWGGLEWPVCAMAFDCCVNHGGFAYILQRAVNDCGGNVVVDGKMGPKTYAGMMGIEAEKLGRAIYEERKKYFEGIVRRKPSQGVFLRGWLRRCEGMRKV